MPELFTIHSLRGHQCEAVAVSGWRPITQADIDRFAAETDDHQWIYVDRSRAEASFGSTIAHGFLTLSLLPAWMEESIAVGGVRAVLNYGLNRVRFVSAVPVNRWLRMHFTPSVIQETADGVQITWDVAVERQGSDKPACVAEWILRYLSDTRASSDHGP